MKILLTALCFCLLFTLSSCSSSAQPSAQDMPTYGIKKTIVKRLQIPRPRSKTPVYFSFTSYFLEKGKEYLAYIFIYEDRKKAPDFAVYSVSDNRYSTIKALPQKYAPYRFCDNFVAINADSFLIKFQSIPPSRSEDSTLILLNKKGEIVKTFDWENVPVILRGVKGKENYKERSRFGFDMSASLMVYDKKLIVPFQRGGENNKLINSLKLVDFGSFSLADETFNAFNLTVPDTIIAKPWAADYIKPFVALSIHQRPLLYFGYSPQIWEEDKNGQLITHKVPPSTLLGQPHPARQDNQNNFENVDPVEPDAGGYLELNTDIYRKRYIRNLALPSLYYLPPNDLPNASGLMLLDENFNKIAEDTIDAVLFHSRFCVTKDGILLGDGEKASKGNPADTMYWKVVALEVDSSRKVIPFSQRKANTADIITYLDKEFPSISPKNGNKVIITVPNNGYCVGCAKFIDEEIGSGKHLKKYSNVSLVYLMSDEKMAAKDYAIGVGIKSPNAYFDEKQKYLSYYLEKNSPTAYFFKGNKLQRSVRMYAANEIPTLKQIQKFVKEKN